MLCPAAGIIYYRGLGEENAIAILMADIQDSLSNDGSVIDSDKRN